VTIGFRLIIENFKTVAVPNLLHLLNCTTANLSLVYYSVYVSGKRTS